MAKAIQTRSDKKDDYMKKWTDRATPEWTKNSTEGNKQIGAAIGANKVLHPEAKNAMGGKMSAGKISRKVKAGKGGTIKYDVDKTGAKNIGKVIGHADKATNAAASRTRKAQAKGRGKTNAKKMGK